MKEREDDSSKDRENKEMKIVPLTSPFCSPGPSDFVIDSSKLKKISGEKTERKRGQ